MFLFQKFCEKIALFLGEGMQQLIDGPHAWLYFTATPASQCHRVNTSSMGQLLTYNRITNDVFKQVAPGSRFRHNELEGLYQL